MNQATVSQAPSATGWRTGAPPDHLLATDVAEAHRLQQMVMHQLQANHFSGREIFGVRLALEEALVNAMKHGNRMDRAKKVAVSFAVKDDLFSVRITDEGNGFDPEDVPDPTLAENLERPSGRGLMLMRYYMDDVEFLGRGNICVMNKRRSPAATHGQARAIPA